jgi:uncharacterized Ntn-hydrolase superfamily protein
MPASVPRFGTFSIVAADLARGEWGVAVQSRFIAVGAMVPWAAAGVGAIATQAYANVRYGPEGLALLRAGRSASEVVEQLTRADPERDHRQLGVVDARGRAAAYTGRACLEYAGQVVGEGFTCQGNILFGAPVVAAMARSFQSTPGDLPERLLAALDAGQREGGDRRGMQSAAMLIVREAGGYDAGSDRWVDLRVDDHPSPIEELRRLFELYDVTLLTREDPATLVRLEGEALRAMERDLGVLGYLIGAARPTFDEKVRAAFSKFLNENNFENKARSDGTAWPSVLRALSERAERELDRRRTTAPTVPGALDRGPGAAGTGGSSSTEPTKRNAPR